MQTGGSTQPYATSQPTPQPAAQPVPQATPGQPVAQPSTTASGAAGDDASTPTLDDDGVKIKTGGQSELTISGYVETVYSYNFNRPSNGITHYRTFDNRHNAITLQNLALDLGWDSKHALARIALQAGHAPNTYYGVSEPNMPGASGTPGSNAELWRYIQQAYVGWHLPGQSKVPITLEGGIFLSPLGPEGMATHENWTWSHTQLFFALPFYHAGARLHLQISDRHDLRFGVYNGWNNVVDNNPQKSLAAEYTYTHSENFLFNIVYFSGIERPPEAIEGQGWRHTVDTYVIGKPSKHVSLLLRPVAGFEPTRFGTAWYLAGHLGVRIQLAEWMYLATKGVLLREHRASTTEGSSAPIFYPTPWMASAIGTADFRPGKHFSLKLEYRHDQAGELLYFAGDVEGDGSDENPFVPTRTSQNTLTLGLTAWF